MNTEIFDILQMVWIACSVLLVIIERHGDLVFKTKNQLALALALSPASLLFLIGKKISSKLSFRKRPTPLNIEKLSDVEKKLFAEINTFLSSIENDKNIVNYKTSRKNTYNFELINFSKKTVKDSRERIFDVSYDLKIEKDYSTYNNSMLYFKIQFKSSNSYLAEDISINGTEEGKKMFDIIAEKVKNLAEEKEKESQKALELEKNKELYELLNNTSHKNSGIIKLK